MAHGSFSRNAPVFDNSGWRDSVAGLAANRRKETVIGCVLGGALLLHALVYAALRKWEPRSKFARAAIRSSQWPTFYLLPTLCCNMAWLIRPFVADESAYHAVRKTATVLLILELGWLSVNVLRAGFASLVRQNKWTPKAPKTSPHCPASKAVKCGHHNLEGGAAAEAAAAAAAAGREEAWRVRKTATQLAAMKSLCYTAVGCGMFAAIVRTFETTADAWVGLLASAGTAGILFGLAAAPSITNHISALTIALCQPISLGDNVAVGAESGVVEEITSQRVVHRLWDGRRLMHPISRFTTTPFANRTKTSSWKIGIVFLYLDPLVVSRLAELRVHLSHVLATEPASRLWDGRIVDLKVTDMKPDGSIEVRILASAQGVGDTADLRTSVREQMHAYTAQRFPGALVRSRCEARIFEDDGESRDRPESDKDRIPRLSPAPNGKS